MHDETFYRPARDYPLVLSADEIVISAPPVAQPTQTGILNWLKYVLPAVGGLGSLVFLFAYHSSLILIIAGIFISLCAIGSGVLLGVLQQRQIKRQYQQQGVSYLEYLASLRKSLVSIAQIQREQDHRLYPSYEILATRIEQREYVWERRPTDLDFLYLRIGLGPGPLSNPLRLDINQANYMIRFVTGLRSQAEALINQFSYLNNLSVTISLYQLGVLTIYGVPSQARALVRALLCQVAANHPPEDVRCLLSFAPENTTDWEWFKWLPHGRHLRQVKAEHHSNSERISMLADSTDDLQLFLRQQIEPEMERRRRLKEEENDTQNGYLSPSTMLPHLVIVLDNFSTNGPIGRLPELRTILNESAALGITVICLVENRSQEPVQVQARLSIANSGALDFVEVRQGGRHLDGLLPDVVTPQLCEKIARSIAPLTMVESGASLDLAQDIRLLDLLDIVEAESIDFDQVRRFRSNADFLRVPIGQCADGSRLYLDLKESADGGMGPHGLIVGATGSGKSELLRTLVIALAITHDPQLLNFVLIDFKGGASFADFSVLPHVAGVVTNLQSDLSLVDRVYSSLLGEQQRRQQMLRDAGNLDNIKQYQLISQQHPAMEPMPHLVIIVDEFAELIAIQPDFLDLFVTMGRVGRSLGLHLLFATQRLEEGRIKGLESHLRFRICLRTFSTIESKTVLGQPDAYYLPAVPGMGYFKVDSDTFDLFKTALVSLPYIPKQTSPSLESMLRIFTTNGTLVPYQQSFETNRIALPQAPHDLTTEMDVVIKHLTHTELISLNNSLYHKTHQVWLPPLEQTLTLGRVFQQCQRPDLIGGYWELQPPFGLLRIPVGLVDMPLQQAQEPLWLDFSGIGGHLALVGAPQTGKSTFLRTLLTAFLLTHSPHEVQFYCLDMGGGQLRIFEQAPHIGSICSRLERDKVRRVVRQMHKIIEDRELLFREHGIDSISTFRSQRQGGLLADIPFGDVFLIIDNFAQFSQEFEQLEAELLEIASSGLTYGVHLIIAANRWAEIRTKLRDNIGTRLELRLNDPIESDLGKATASAIPVGVPGRGANKEKQHFQAALPMIEYHKNTLSDRNHLVQEELLVILQRIYSGWNGETAPSVNMLPILVNQDTLPAATKESGIPLGLEEMFLSPFFLDLIAKGPHFFILGDTESGKTSLLRTWLRGIEQGYSPQETAFAIVDFRRQLLDFTTSKHLLTYAYNAPTLTACVGNLKVDLDRRLQRNSDVSLDELRKPQIWTGRHYFLFIDDYEMLMTAAGNPLAPLTDFLLAGQDIGFHLVVAHRVSGMSRASFEPIFQRLREMGTAALIMSGDPMEGKIIYGQAAGPLPPGRGIFVQPKHAPLLIQTALTQPQYANE